jgi:prefoldin subunit 5
LQGYRCRLRCVHRLCIGVGYERMTQAEELQRLKKSFADLQSKSAKQRNEIARLTQAVERLQKDKAKLINDLKWIKGETK